MKRVFSITFLVIIATVLLGQGECYVPPEVPFISTLNVEGSATIFEEFIDPCTLLREQLGLTNSPWEIGSFSWQLGFDLRRSFELSFSYRADGGYEGKEILFLLYSGTDSLLSVDCIDEVGSIDGEDCVTTLKNDLLSRKLLLVSMTFEKDSILDCNGSPLETDVINVTCTLSDNGLNRKVFSSNPVPVEDVLHCNQGELSFKLTWDSVAKSFRMAGGKEHDFTTTMFYIFEDLVAEYFYNDSFVSLHGIGISTNSVGCQIGKILDIPAALPPPSTGCQSKADLRIGWIPLGQPGVAIIDSTSVRGSCWQIERQGDGVRQTVKGLPTMFALPADLINFSLDFKVQTPNEVGDVSKFIGMTFGMRYPSGSGYDYYDMWLFDWRGQDRNREDFEGYSLVRVKGNIPLGTGANETLSLFEEHINHPDLFDIRTKNWAEGSGWEYGNTYDISLTYSRSRIVITIDGEEFINYVAPIGEEFKTGWFGFYNAAQADIYYSDFSYRLLGEIELATFESCVDDIIEPIYKDTEGNVYYDAAFTWNYDDGNITKVLPQETHVYKLAGAYNIQLLDANNCALEATMNVLPLPEINLANDTTICTGEMLVLDASHPNSNRIYNWSTGGTGARVTIDREGDYWVEVSEDECISIDSIHLSISDLSNIRYDLKPSCFELATGNIELTIERENYEVFLDNISVGQQQLFQHLGAGMYEIEVLDEFGCSFYDVFTIEELPSLIINYEVKIPSCHDIADASIQIVGATDATQFMLQPSGLLQNQTYSNLTAGNYTLSYWLITHSDCIYTEEITIQNPLPLEVVLEDTISIFYGDTVELTPIPSNDEVSYEWSSIDQTISCLDCPSITATPTTNTRYTVQICTNVNCCIESSITVLVNNEVHLYIPTAFSPNLDGVNDFFLLQSGTSQHSIKEIHHCRIFNRVGGMVFEQENFQSDDRSYAWDGFFNGKLAQDGVYLYHIELEAIDGRIIEYVGTIFITK